MNRHERGVVLADDATGALECASILAGLQHEVAISIGLPQDGALGRGVLVVDLESRNLQGGDARRLVGQCLETLQVGEGVPVYQKTDSALRGNIAGNLLEMLARAKGGSVVYVPAYPKLGRTVRQGRLFVDGHPLEETAFATDVRHPARSSYILDLFAENERGFVVVVEGEAELQAQLLTGVGRILVCDATTDEDLARISDVLRVANKGTVAAGPSGFVGHWASLFRFPVMAGVQTPQIRSWLVVCGSLHPQSRAQLEFAVKLGVPSLASDAHEVLSPDEASARLAQAVAERVRQDKPDAILIMGGDTAYQVWKALGVSVLVPLPEVLPGIAACRSPELDLLFVTKAGGFGEHGLVQQVIEKFQ